MKKTIAFIIISLFTFHFSIFTYSQDLYIGSFYVTTPEEESLYGDGGDKWANRMSVICDMVNFEQPDVLGLQSLTTNQFSQINARTKSSYNAVGNILCNKTLELLASGDVEDMPEGSTCSWVKVQKEDAAFYVFNICFSADNSIANTSATRVRLAATEINAEKLPCFIVGYLGVSSTKTAYTRLNGRWPDCYTKTSSISAEFGTVNNFDLEANHGTDRYDFVFASTNVNVKAYGQLQYGYYTKEADGSYKRRLPSTHFPVMVKATLK